MGGRGRGGIGGGGGAGAAALVVRRAGGGDGGEEPVFERHLPSGCVFFSLSLAKEFSGCGFGVLRPESCGVEMLGS